ncbi:hypothetical protein D3C85_1776120 [compost metagenome]
MGNSRVHLGDYPYLIAIHIAELEIILPGIGCITYDGIYLHSIGLGLAQQLWQFRTISLFC